mgnify:CR=1 FL=1
MKARAVQLAQQVATALAIALGWMALFNFNALIFSPLAHSSQAHWIFLPAALRIIMVLVFRDIGVIGLMFGAFLTLPHPSPSELPHEIILAISSGFAPMIAVYLCRRLFHIAYDLSGLRPLHIIGLSLAGAVMNSLLLNGYLAISGRLNGDVEQILTVFVGDTLGTAIVLLILSTILSFVMPRRKRTRRLGGHH